MWERLQKLFDRIESRIALWQIVRGTGILSVGLISGWLSSGADLIDRFGAFGWWIAFLVGCVLAASVLWLVASFRLRFAQAAALNKWKDQVDAANPLDPEFTRKRLNLMDLASPIDGRISKKRFIDCQLLGRVNLHLTGCKVSGPVFTNCDFVVYRPGAVLLNAISLEHCQIIGGEIANCTVFITDNHWEATFGPIDSNLVSYARSVPPEPQLLPDTESETPR